MSEFQIFGVLLAIIAVVLVAGIIPLALFRFLREVRLHKEGHAPEVRDEKEGVSTRFVNVVDALALLLIFGMFSYTWWLQKPIPGEDEVAHGVIDAEVLWSNGIGQCLVVLVVCALLFWRVSLAEQFGLSLKGRWKSLWWCPLVLIVSWGVTGLVEKAGYFEYLEQLYGKSPLQAAVLLLQESTDPYLLSLMAFVACVGAPVSEEVLFRGYIYPVVKGVTGRWVGILFSGLLFGLIHYNLGGLPTLVLMGCLLALAYEKTGSLWVPVITHMAFNTATTVIQIASRFSSDLKEALAIIPDCSLECLGLFL